MANQKPATMRETVDKIYYAVWGTNGDDGMKHDVEEGKQETKELRTKVDDFMLHREETCPIQRRQEWSWRKKIAYYTLQLGVMGFILTLLGMLAKCSGVFELLSQAGN